MNILIFVHNLIPEKSHLMPWRTVCEVTNHGREYGHDIHLISLGEHEANLSGGIIPQDTKQIAKHLDKLSLSLQVEINRLMPDVVFWPASWRDSTRRIEVITRFNLPVVLWFPGGVYSLSACLHAIRVISLRGSLPYLAEALSNKRKKVKWFKRYGVKCILTMTQETADSATEVGWPKSRSYVVPPGKEHSVCTKSLYQIPGEFSEWLGGRPFYLFMGPPSGIRGIFNLIEAFDAAAEQNTEICLVCLFRADAVLDSAKVKETISKSRHSSRIFTHWESLGVEVLNSFMARCHAVVMPFVLVPSEIPLAIIEAMAWGKPIITTSPGGTGEFVKEFGRAPKVGDIEGLAGAMIDLAVDCTLYKEKCKKTQAAYESHPDWRNVAHKWIKVASDAAGSNR